jgi:hypothetical protein
MTSGEFAVEQTDGLDDQIRRLLQCLDDRMARWAESAGRLRREIMLV